MNTMTLEERATNYETSKHINRVRELLDQIVVSLLKRAEEHDKSKLSSPEVELFTEYTDKLKHTTYGSDEYEDYRGKLKVALDHHYQNNRHHPEWHRQNEVFVPISGYEGIYEISSYGTVRSLDRVVARDKTGGLTKKGQTLKANVTPKGYLRIQLQKDGSCEHKFVHVLVAENFIENTNNKPYVNHIDGDKMNNHISNLEWVTSSENLIHAYENGLAHPTTKYLVECPSLGLTSFGCLDMERQLRKLGYEKASAASIYRCINEEGAKHLDIEFIGSKLEEYEDSPLNSMNLLDLIEMMADWVAASERHENGDIRRSIEHNAKRFKMSPQLVKIFENTADLL
jgi:hypothetical protein